LGVELLQEINDSYRVDPLSSCFQSVDVAKVLYFLEVGWLGVIEGGFFPFGLGLAHSQQQGIVHDVELLEDFQVSGDVVNEFDFVLAGHVDEAVGRVEVVDVLQDGGVGVLDFSLDGRAFQVVQLVLYVVDLEVFEGVLHHEEVYFGDFCDLD